jgi:hypothetical protein
MNFEAFITFSKKHFLNPFLKTCPKKLGAPCGFTLDSHRETDRRGLWVN